MIRFIGRGNEMTTRSKILSWIGKFGEHGNDYMKNKCSYLAIYKSIFLMGMVLSLKKSLIHLSPVMAQKLNFSGK
jgi:hypothetical protein